MKTKPINLTLFFFLFCPPLFSQTWITLGQGIYNNTQAFNNIQDNDVRSIYGDSITQSIYAGGHFIYISDKLVRGIARWDSAGWDSLGLGMDVQGNNNDSTNWPGLTLAITRFNGSIYTGGTYQNASGVSANGFARWDGLAWHNSGDVPGIVGFLQDESYLYAFGFFDSISGGVPSSKVARFDGNQWYSMNAPFDPAFGAGACGVFYNGKLFVGGNFESTSQPGLADIACWDSTAGTWSSVGGGLSGFNTHINCMAVYNGELYVGGYFGISTGEAGDYIMKWNGSTWSQVGGGLDPCGQVETMKVYHGALFIGRQSACGSTPQQQTIAKWDGTQWQSVTSAPEFSSSGSPVGVLCMTILNDELYIGGGFDTLDGIALNSIAKYDDVTSVFEPLISENQIQIFPNPVSDNLTVTSASREKKQLNIYNTVGQVLFTGNFSSQKHSLNVSAFAKGIYFIEVRTEKTISTKKIIKL